MLIFVSEVLATFQDTRLLFAFVKYGETIARSIIFSGYYSVRVLPRLLTLLLSINSLKLSGNFMGTVKKTSSLPVFVILSILSSGGLGSSAAYFSISSFYLRTYLRKSSKLVQFIISFSAGS